VAYAHVQSRNFWQTGNASYTLAYNSPLTAGNLAVLGVTSWTDTVSSLVWSAGSSGAPQLATSKTDLNAKSYIYYSASTSSGAHTAQITFNATNAGTLTVAEYSGIIPSSPLDQTFSGSANADSWTTPATAALAQARNLVVGVGTTDTGVNEAFQSSDCTIRQSEQDNSTRQNHTFQDKRTSSTAGVTVNFDQTGGTKDWRGSVAVFKEARGTAMVVQESHTAIGVTGGVATRTVQLPSNWTAGNKILVFGQVWSSGGSTASVADNQGFTWTQLASVQTSVDNGQFRVWETNVGGSSPGTNPTITLTASVNPSYLTLMVMEVEGLNTSGSPVDASGTGAANNASPTSTTSGSVAAGGAYALACYADSGWGQAVTAHTGYTTIGYQASASGSAMPVHVSVLDTTPDTGSTWTSQTDVAGSTGWGHVSLVFKPAVAVAPPQDLAPISDTSVGTWTTNTGATTNLYQAIDESEASISDTDYVQSVADPATAAYEVGLASGADPLSSIDHKVSVRALVNPNLGGTTTLTTELRQGGSALSTPASWNDALTGTAQRFDHILSSAQADAITDYSTLRLRFTANQVGLAAPVWVSPAGTAQSATTGAVTAPWPTGHQAGDIGLLFIERNGGANSPVLSTAAGFVEVTGSPQSTGTTTAGTKLSVFWCRATGGAQTSPVVTAPTTSADHTYAVILIFRGCVSTGNPWDGTPVGGVKAAASTSATVTGLTTTVPNTLLVQSITKDLDATAAFASAQTNGNLSGIAEHFDAGTISGLGGGIAVWSGTKAAAGATGNTTVTVTSSINAFHTLALRPEPDASRARVTWAQFEAPGSLATSYTREASTSAALQGTATRQVVSSAAVSSANITRQVAGSTAVSLANITRQIAASTAVSKANITRSAAASAAVLGVAQRQISVTTAVSKADITRQLASSVAVSLANLTRQLVSSAAISRINQTRTAVASVAVLGVAQRQVPSSAAISLVNLTRQVAGSTAITQINLSRQVSGSAAVLRTLERQVAGSAAVQATYNRQITSTAAFSGALVRQVGTSAYFSLANITRVAAVSVAVQKTLTRAVSTSGAILSVATRSVSASVAVSSVSLTRQVSVAASISETVSGASRQVQSTAAFSQANITRQVVASARLSLTGLTRQLASAAALLAVATRTVSVTASLQATLTRQVSTSAAVAAPNLTRSISSSASTSAPLLGTYRQVAAAASFSAFAVTRQVATAAAFSRANLTRAVVVDTAVSTTATRQLAASGAVSTSTVRTVLTSAALAQAGNTRQIGADAAVLAVGLQRAVPTSVTLGDTVSRQVAVTAAFAATVSRQIATSTSLLLSLQRVVDAEAALQGTSTRAVSGTARLSQAENERAVSATASIAVAYTRTVPASASFTVLSGDIRHPNIRWMSEQFRSVLRGWKTRARSV
jgi:hypothetical protein